MMSTVRSARIGDGSEQFQCQNCVKVTFSRDLFYVSNGARICKYCINNYLQKTPSKGNSKLTYEPFIFWDGGDIISGLGDDYLLTNEEYVATKNIEQVVESLTKLNSLTEKMKVAHLFFNGVTKMFGYEEDAISAIISVYCEKPIYGLDDPRHNHKFSILSLPCEFSIEYFLFLIAQLETETDLFNSIKDYHTKLNKKNNLTTYVFGIILFLILPLLIYYFNNK